MSYVITHSNGKTFTTLGEGVLDNSLGISLIGQNYHNYGQLIANNFLQILEHQANDTPPPNPVAGQIWWNTQTHVLSFFDGDKFKPCSSSAVAVDPPMKPLQGDQWWDTINDQLKVYTGIDWEVVGPSYPKGQSFTGLLPIAVTDIQSNTHIISELLVNGTIVAVVNKDDAFILATPINGILSLTNGITLVPTASLNGTASNAHHLDGIPADSYLRKDASTNTLSGDLFIQGFGGLTVGTQTNLTISTDANNKQIIWSDNSDISLLAGSESLTANVSTGTFTLTGTPTVPSSIATKSYVDSTADLVDINNHAYTDLQIASLIDSSPISTLRVLSAAIDNDPMYYINENARLAFKADVVSPVFSGIPESTTPDTTDNSTRIATTAYVKSNDNIVRASLQSEIDSIVATINALAPKDSPNFTGVPLTPTVDNILDDSTKIVNTHFLKQKMDALNSDIQAELSVYAPINNPTFIGLPKAPTPSTGDRSKQIATTEYVKTNDDQIRAVLQSEIDSIMATIISLAPKDSPDFTGTPQTATILDITDDSKKIVNTHFLKQKIDALNSYLQAALLVYAPINSPIFTGLPQSPTPNLSDNSKQIATTSFVNSNLESTRSTLQAEIDSILTTIISLAPRNSPNFLGVPTTVTVTDLSDDSTKIVNTHFLKQKIDALSSYIQAALTVYAPINSPSFTGLPLAPTPVDGTKTTQVATTKFVDSALTSGITAIVAADSTFKSIVVNDSILPTLDTSADLGSTSKKFRNVNGVTFNVASAILPTADGVVDVGSSAAKIRTLNTNSINVTSSILPTTGTADLGSATNQFRSIYSTNLTVSGSIIPNSNNTIDVGSSSARFRNVYGNAMSSNYADLAENYLSDAIYVSGTVVVFGGKEEVTVSDQYCDSRIAGVVSTNPAYLMNDSVLGVSVALTGKVPCKVVGPVKKGDLMVNSAFAGVARALIVRADWTAGCIIGKSLENSAETGIRTIMVSVGRF